MTTTTDTKSKAAAGAPSWRNLLKVHPEADRYPVLSKVEREALAEDIKANGLRSRVVVMRKAVPREDGMWSHDSYDVVLLDGRNRLDAIELAGFKIVSDKKYWDVLKYRNADGEWVTISEPVPDDVADKDDVAVRAYINSLNLHRRHLLREQIRDRVAEMLKADPSQSDRQIAKLLNVGSHHTVGAVRKKLERRGQVAHVPTRTDSKGRKQPAAKRSARKTAAAPALPSLPARDDIGENSQGEIERQRVRQQELENEARRTALHQAEAAKLEESKRETLMRVASAAFHNVCGFASPEFNAEIAARLGDDEFRRQLKHRMRLHNNPTTDIRAGADALAALVTALRGDETAPPVAATEAPDDERTDAVPPPVPPKLLDALGGDGTQAVPPGLKRAPVAP